jgi:metallo-beta-lactamase class B
LRPPGLTTLAVFVLLAVMSRLLFLALLATLAPAQRENWKNPFPPHTIAGNLHYVGTEDLACFLITTPGGHILINTGLEDSTPLLRAGIEKLGFKLEDIKILLTMQAHFDHVAAFAEIQKLTGARMYATEQDAPVLEDGGKSDPFLDERYGFKPLQVHRRLKDGETIRLGGTELVVHLMPGHTKGSASYSMTVIERGKILKVLIANMSSVVMPLVGNSKYPQIVEDFERSFKAQKALSPDIWVAAHASHYDMDKKYKAGSFVDPEGYRAAVEEFEKRFRTQLAGEQKR